MAGDFLDRALHEAARYGADPWVFVRELLQNARDAHATIVMLNAVVQDGCDCVVVRDNGRGMSFEHAQRFLFTLYASSKAGQEGEAGRFGVGFWSVLRFQPDCILVRSYPSDGTQPWEVSLSRGLSKAVRRIPPPANTSGTQIVLVRPAGKEKLAERLRDAAWRNARFLRRKDDPDQPLRLFVDGEEINAPFELPAPSASFRRGNIRGVVALGPSARVELFSKGLWVRSAAVLEDLLSSSSRRRRSAARFPELADGLAPQVLLECGDLELKLSRSDARESRALRRAVELATLELERLVERQIAFSRRDLWWRRMGDWLRARKADAIVAVISSALVTGILSVVWPHLAPRLQNDGAPAAPRVVQSYGDLAAHYQGPTVEAMSAPPIPMAIRYTPAEASLYLAAGEISALDAQGHRTPAEASVDSPRYAAPPCTERCVELEVFIAAGPGALRLPTPTGHRVDPRSVRFEDQPLGVLASTEDEPFVYLYRPVQGWLRYRTGPAAPPEPAPRREQPGLPPELDPVITALRARGSDEEGAVRDALAYVRRAVVYSRSAETARIHHDAAARGEGFVERTLKIGAGDCDVQSGVLMELLQRVGIPARLAIGFVGNRGQVDAELHAWVEYLPTAGAWRVVDPSTHEAPALDAEAPRGFGLAQRPPIIGRDRQVMPPASPLPPAPARPASPQRPVAEAAYAPPASDPPQVAAVLVDPSDVPPERPATRSTPPAVAALPSAARFPIDPFRLLFAALAAGGAVALVGLLRQGTSRSTRLTAEHDLSQLLQGALQRPDAFRNVPALFHSRLVPRAGGGAISLSEAGKLALQGRLYATTRQSKLAAQAARGGAVVIDDSQRAGATVAKALGAVDLDDWDALLAASGTTPLLDAVNAFLRARGEAWTVRSAPSPRESPAVLEFPARSASGSTRVVVVAEGEPWLAEAAQRAERQPRQALFSALDVLLEKMSFPDEARARLLSPLAVEALQERETP